MNHFGPSDSEFDLQYDEAVMREERGRRDEPRATHAKVKAGRLMVTLAGDIDVAIPLARVPGLPAGSSSVDLSDVVISPSGERSNGRRQRIQAAEGAVR